MRRLHLTRFDLFLLFAIPGTLYIVAEVLDFQERYLELMAMSEPFQFHELMLIPRAVILALVVILLRHVRILRRVAHVDLLTGLLNRRAFMGQLGHHAESPTGGYAVLFLDLDGFKEINDEYGHHCGDLVLQEVAFRLRSCLPEQALVSRFGGDEFCVMLPGVRDGAAALHFARRIEDALRLPLGSVAGKRHLSASIGIAVAPAGGVAPVDTVRDADLAMYSAKRSGKARAVVFAPELQREPRHALYDLGVAGD